MRASGRKDGSPQFIYSIPLALGTKRALIIGPTYADYADACSMHNIHFEYFSAHEPQGFKTDMNMIKKQEKPKKRFAEKLLNLNLQ